LKTIRLLWVGKTRQPYLNDGIRRYIRLASPWLAIKTVEIRQARNAGDPERAMALEGERILRETDEFVLLDSGGRVMDSRAFAGFLGGTLEDGPGDWVIGGTYGVSREVRQRARARISLSRLTFTHEMVRLVALEQIYRALTIIHGKKYHY
jgi:23S rRNA (pseudouridine1915-N3)-methyltransferase